MLELPLPKLQRKNKSSCCENAAAKAGFTSPLVEEYERVAGNYRAYMNELAAKIEAIHGKEDYRSYLKEQKLNSIKSHLIAKKQTLEKQLEEKLDPAKSANGKLHSEILSLAHLETNYSSILAHIQNSLLDKQEQIKRAQKATAQQKQIIKHLIKHDFKHAPQQTAHRLPKIPRNASESSFLSRESAKAAFRHSREGVLDKLSSTLISETHARIHSEQQKVIMLRLFALYHHAQPNSHQHSSCLAESLQKQLAAREQIIRQAKKELGQIEQQARTSVHRD